MLEGVGSSGPFPEQPIREILLEKVKPLIARLKGKHSVIGWDVQLQTFQSPTGTFSTWAIIILTSGAILGPEYYLSYVWTLGETPQIPSERILNEAVKETFRRLSLMRQQQLRQAGGGSPSAN